MRHAVFVFAALLLAVTPPAWAQTAKPAAQPAANLARLVQQVRIPYQQFTLANGLRVIVHTDRKAPVVAVSVWYNVGSKHEPKGKTGFAHLFEHLMFNGSENAPGDYFEPMRQIGATGMNGTTWYDRTNYYQTVPTGALERALFLESDRMGHLLGAVTQTNLDNQRGVVQNEKRQSDNQPLGMLQYAQSAALFPADHPYGHSAIGSMSDLDAASLDDVHGWFRAHYAPNNAVLVLAGDIDVTTARPLAERYFGSFVRGPANATPAAPVPTLARRIDQVLHDRVASTYVMRSWVVPGLNDPDAVPLAIGTSVLGGLGSSRLDNVLVRDEKLAVRVSAGLQSFAQMGQIDISVEVRPGVDPALVSKRLDTLIGDLIAGGPNADEVARAATGVIAQRIRGLEGSSSKARTLAEGVLYSGDPDHYRKELAAYAAATPATVRAALGRWLTRPVYALTVVPGPREAAWEGGERSRFLDATRAVSQTRPVPALPDNQVASRRGTMGSGSSAASADVDRSQLPPVRELRGLDFPVVTRGRLSNGMELVYARRATVPISYVVLSADAGFAADPRDRQGVVRMTTSLLKEGTTTLSSAAIAKREEELGATVVANSSLDRTNIVLSGLTGTLEPSLDLLADVVRNPAFASSELERLRGQQLARISNEAVSPEALAQRYLMPALYGDHPYGIPGTNGTAAAVKALTRDDIVSFHRAWLRPDKIKIFVVSDLPFDKIEQLMEARFGDWKGEGRPGTKSFAAPIPAPQPRIILVDRKDAPQSLIAAGLVLPGTGADDNVDLASANEILGGGFLSRINMDLRETKGWSYGVRSSVGERIDRMVWQVSAPVQADRTGDAIAALREDITAFLGPNGVTAVELERTVNGRVRELPGAYELSAAVLGAIMDNDQYRRPDTYPLWLEARYRAMRVATLDRTARKAFDPANLVWVVVGDADKVRPQLDKLGLPVDAVTPR